MTRQAQGTITARKGLPVLYAFGFERVGVVVGDLYFVDPNPREGQEGAEHGVRLELRVFGRGELKGTIYSAQPIEIGQPIWRADLLESVAGRPGSFDRTHHHPAFTGWNPGSGQEGPEHGVRVELRVLGRGELRGTIYSAQPIEVGQPIWRAE